ncbi:MAG: exodeoxyribonuclease VII large subunit [Tyzzerella sp.]|uniref:Exodeoxyribonuclease 7 large subunit n=1 Tax=Candidatus Fimicola merdigallinarum TaxID=2840819 RepID=A0A9D9H3M0_9FIRM|nr:exodeoxyribonuclease VII large subunit [Candidatus Fimicola merdigallinarum]
MIEPKIFSVMQINSYIKNIIENDFILNSLWIKGEISNFKYHSTGHMYFTLKDRDASLNCVMFKGSADMLPFMPENGMSVVVYGYISIYEKTGQYQLYAEIMEPLGIGSMNIAFEQLKEKLSNEGLFDEDYKREICKYPKCIGVITSPVGAAVRDIINVSKRRNKGVKIVVVPALVQGENAVDSIVSALKLINEWGKCDTIILGRGGGSMEDLQAFNDERVARAIFASEIPVISAVGHETDFTIADFVSDMRAPTPSAGAELAVNSLEFEEERLKKLFDSLNNNINYRLNFENERLKNLTDRRIFKKPLDNIFDREMYISGLEKQMEKIIKNKVIEKSSAFDKLINKMEVLSPMAMLKRGYTIVENTKGESLKSIEDFNCGDTLNILFKDGQVKAKVIDILEKEW